MSAVIVERRGKVLVLKLNNPPVNGLGAAVRTILAEAIRKGQSDGNFSAFVVVGEGRMFSAGADIREFNTRPPAGTPDLNDVINDLEMSEKPVVAAIHGVAAGGGLELALGAHYRVCVAKALVGLPEVTLGILPVAGGTQRLPRIAGVKASLDLITSGRLISVDECVKLGFIDEVTEYDYLETAVATAERLADEGWVPNRARERTEGLAEAEENPSIFADFKKGTAKAARGTKAPYACVDCVQAAVTKPIDEGIKFEREEFKKLVTGTESKSMRHAFFAGRKVTKIPDVPKTVTPKEIKSAAIIGCGTMGGGIAMNFANGGIPVIVVERDQTALQAGVSKIRVNYAATVSKNRLSQDAMDTRVSLVTGVTELEAIEDADIVIEAVFEEMDIKKNIFRNLDMICKSGAVLATNTSTLDVDEIASVTDVPKILSAPTSSVLPT